MTYMNHSQLLYFVSTIMITVSIIKFDESSMQKIIIPCAAISDQLNNLLGTVNT